MTNEPYGNVPVTQFLRPDGRQSNLSAPVYSRAVYDKAMEAVKAGVRFTAEVIGYGEVSLVAEWKGDDIAIELANNGPEIDGAFERVIERAWEKSR